MELAGFHGHFNGVSISQTVTEDLFKQHQICSFRFIEEGGWRKVVSSSTEQMTSFLVFPNFSFLSVRLSDNSFKFPPLTWDFSGSSLWNLKVLFHCSAASRTTAGLQSHPFKRHIWRHSHFLSQTTACILPPTTSLYTVSLHLHEQLERDQSKAQLVVPV